MRPVTLGLLGTAVLSVALTAGLLLIRRPRDPEVLGSRAKGSPAGESDAGTISLDRIRAMGY